MYSYHAGAMALSEAQFGSAMGPIFLGKPDCSGSETSLLECRYYTALGLSTCQHSEDASVRCVGKYLLHHRPSLIDAYCVPYDGFCYLPSRC